MIAETSIARAFIILVFSLELRAVPNEHHRLEACPTSAQHEYSDKHNLELILTSITFLPTAECPEARSSTCPACLSTSHVVYNLSYSPE